MATTAMAPPPPSLELPRRRPPTPLQNEIRRNQSASRAMDPTMTPTRSMNRMSRFRMWLISWPMTPWSSSRSIFWTSPVVTANDACLGSRPVANAFGAVSSIRYTRGRGRPLASRISSTTFMSCL